MATSRHVSYRVRRPIRSAVIATPHFDPRPRRVEYTEGPAEMPPALRHRVYTSVMVEMDRRVARTIT